MSVSSLPRRHVRRLHHLRLPPFVLREVLATSPDEQFGRAMLHLILDRQWEARARRLAARRERKGGAV